MITEKINEQEAWMISQIKPFPTHFVVAYAGTNCKEWKLVWLGTESEYSQIGNVENLAKEKYASVMLVKLYYCGEKKVVSGRTGGYSPCGGCSPESTSNYADCAGCQVNPDKPRASTEERAKGAHETK